MDTTGYCILIALCIMDYLVIEISHFLAHPFPRFAMIKGLIYIQSCRCKHIEVLSAEQLFHLMATYIPCSSHSRQCVRQVQPTEYQPSWVQAMRG